MLRRLPILIVFLLCTSCFTFFTSIEPPADADADADTPDMMVADTNDADSDARLPDGGDPPNDMADVGDMSDVADMRDAADMPDVPYIWDGNPDAPLMLQSVANCTAPTAHPSLPSANWPTGEFEDDIDLIPLQGGQSAAQLGWIDDGEGLTTTVMLGDEISGHTIGSTAMILNPSNTLPLSDIVLGPRDDPTTLYSFATTGTCTTEPLASILDDMNSLTIGCPPSFERPIRVEVIEAAGGFNPFSGAAGPLGATAIWQEVVGQPTPKLVASGNGFGRESGINAEWPNPRLSNNFSIGTHGNLAFFPDAAGTLFSWNITNASLADTPGGPPFQTDLEDVQRGQIDVIKIDAQRYIVARVVSDAIELSAYDHPGDDSSTFTRIGRWYAITDLHNPEAVKLATFQGGFVLWYQESGLPTGGSESFAWSVHPFEVGGDTLQTYGCPYTHRYEPIEYRDIDVAAWRVDTDLIVLGAVNFRYNGGQHINLEGPFYDGLFQ